MPTPGGNIAERLRANARAFPDRAALVFPRRKTARAATDFDRWTYWRVDRVSDAYARGLRNVGIGRGTKTIVMLAPGPELFALVFALFKLGAIPVIVDPGMGAKRMLHCYETVKAEAFIGIPLAHLVRLARPKTFRAAKILVTVGSPKPWGGVSLDDIAEHSDDELPIEPVSFDETLVVNFTTGSTGPARGVEYTHGGAAAMVGVLPRLYGDHERAVTFVTLPLFALFDMLLGVTAVLAPMNPTKPALVDAQRMVDVIAAFEATHMFASPAFLNRVGRWAAERSIRLPSLRVVVSGGAPVMPRILEQFRSVLDASARMHATYGATEALPMASVEATELLEETREKTMSGGGTCAGYPTEGLEVRVVTISDAAMPIWSEPLRRRPGEVGEIVVRGAIVSPRYHDDPHNDALAKIHDGRDVWHRTGDLGSLDDEGRLWFCGRKSQRVVTPEKTLVTVACEGVFNGHPMVYRAALVGVGARGEQRPVVCVELRDRLLPTEMVTLESELRQMAGRCPVTHGLTEFLFHPVFPVDIRHNAKIDREELAGWAERRLAGRTTATWAARWARAVPIAGWVFLAYGLAFPFAAPPLRALWWVDVVLSVGVHALQLFVAVPVGRRAGYSATRAVASTLLLGATWWKALEPRELLGRRRAPFPTRGA